MGKGGLDPNDPLVNNSSEYMYQMATIVHHTLDGDQNVDADRRPDRCGDRSPAHSSLTAPTTASSRPTRARCSSPARTRCPVNGRYWTGFDRTDLLDGPAREAAWSGTAHALVAELGVGAATHSTLMLALGIAGLLAGLGVVCTGDGRRLPLAHPPEHVQGTGHGSRGDCSEDMPKTANV